MADITLCSSTTCHARAYCRRNSECPTALTPDKTAQWYAEWHPEIGHLCPGFVEGREPYIDY